GVEDDRDLGVRVAFGRTRLGSDGGRDSVRDAPIVAPAHARPPASSAPPRFEAGSGRSDRLLLPAAHGAALPSTTPGRARTARTGAVRRAARRRLRLGRLPAGARATHAPSRRRRRARGAYGCRVDGARDGNRRRAPERFA